MKKEVLIFSLASLLFNQCTFDKSPGKIDYDQVSIQLMKDLEPKIVGRWTIRQVQIKYQDHNYNQKKLKIAKDTTFVNFGTLTIAPTTEPRSSPTDLRRGECDGTIQYGSKTYPIQFDLLAGSAWVVSQRSPQAYFLLQYKFPVGSHIPEAEETYLEDIGLMGDNFSLEITSDPQRMIWRGLNRGVSQIELVRQ